MLAPIKTANSTCSLDLNILFPDFGVDLLDWQVSQPIAVSWSGCHCSDQNLPGEICLWCGQKQEGQESMVQVVNNMREPKIHKLVNYTAFIKHFTVTLLLCGLYYFTISKFNWICSTQKLTGDKIQSDCSIIQPQLHTDFLLLAQI